MSIAMVYLGELGDWLDGAVAGGTLALAVVTYLMARATSATVRGSERPVLAMTLDRRQSNADGLRVTVRNVGPGAALNVDLRALPSTRGEQNSLFSPVPALSFDALGAGDELEVTIPTGPRDPDRDFWTLGTGRVVTASYQSVSGQDYWTNAILDDMEGRTTSGTGKLPKKFELIPMKASKPSDQPAAAST